MTKPTNQTSPKTTNGITVLGSRTISIDSVLIPEDFHICDIDSDKVEELKLSYQMSKYVPAIEVSKTSIDGQEVFQVVQGRNRINALQALFDNDMISGEISVIEISGELTDLLAHAIRSVRGNKVNSLQLAKAYKRLSELGLSQTDIAKALGVTGAEVSNYLLLSDTPEELQNMIVDGKVSSTFVYERVRRYGYEAALLMAKEEARAKAEKEKAKATGEYAPLSTISPLTKKLTIQPKKVKKSAELIGTLLEQVMNPIVSGDNEIELEVDQETAMAILALSNEMMEIDAHNVLSDDFMSNACNHNANMQAA